MYSLRFALCGFQRAGALRTEYLPLFSKGDDSGGDTPLPIPNREVKPASADGTAEETPWESRSSPISHSAAHSFRDSASRRRRNALPWPDTSFGRRSEEHTSELQSHSDLVCRLLLEKKKKK